VIERCRGREAYAPGILFSRRWGFLWEKNVFGGGLWRMAREGIFQ